MDLEQFLESLREYKREFFLSKGREPVTMEEFETYLRERKNRLSGRIRLKSVGWMFKNGKGRAESP